MENKTNSNKKMLTIATSISMVMLSASALLLSVKSTFADPAPLKLPVFSNAQKMPVSSGCELYPFGMVNGKAYWIEYNATGWAFKISETSGWTNIDK